jgi:hypothetical protein
LQEVQRYIKAADQKRLMLEAMARLGGTNGEQNCLTSENRGDTSDSKPLTTKEEIDAGGDSDGTPMISAVIPVLSPSGLL